MDYDTKNNQNKKIEKLMSTEVKSMVAKLLARENITIQRGNFDTASFNLKTRVLELPLWETINNDVLDLFIGHEISHALNTPADGAELFASRCKGIPFSVCNIIEDIRIEKMVQKEYPGLISSFKAGYTFLHDNDFFKLDSIPMADRTLVDRINIKAKLRDLVEVPFAADEMELVNAAFNCNSYDEVLETVNLFKEKLGDVENNEPGESDEEPDADGEGEGIPSEGDDYSDDSETEESGSGGSGDWMSPEDDETDESNDDSDGNGNSDNESDDDSDDTSNGSGGQDDGWKDDGTEAEAEETKTPIKGAGQYGSQSQDALNDNLSNDRLDKDLDDYDVRHFNFIAPTNEMIEDAIVSYEDVRKSRLASNEFQDALVNGFYSYYRDNNTSAIELYKKFNSTSKRFVNSLKMEFEMKKSAYQYTRATVAKTGKIDVNALHAYKYSEDIFNSITTLADAKSHGMIFLIDMSGSMSNVIGTIYKQTINLSMFCKAVGIPFKVYGFTSTYANTRGTEFDYQDGQFDMSDLHMTELLTSDLKKSKWKEALYHMFVASEMFESRSEPSRAESMGGTPLGLATIAIMKKTKEFIAKHKIEKTSIMYLTDGSGHNPRVRGRSVGYGGTGIGKLNGKQCVLSSRNTIEKDLNEHLKKTTGATMTHFFLVDSKAGTRQAGYASLSNDEWKVMKKDKIVTRDAAGGFDRVFIVKNDRNQNLTDANDFGDIETGGMTDNQLAKAFTKNQVGRKTDRVFVNKFIGMVA
jgi:hypothetical protein